MRFRTSLTGLLLAGLSAVGLAQPVPNLYDLTDLGLPAGASGVQPNKINRFGDVAGSVQYSANTKPFLYTGGVMTQYGFLNGQAKGLVEDLNNPRRMIGTSGITGTVGTFWIGGSISQIPTASRGSSINNGNGFMFDRANGSAWVYILPWDVTKEILSPNGGMMQSQSLNDSYYAVGREWMGGESANIWIWQPPTSPTTEGTTQAQSVKRQGDTDAYVRELVEVNRWFAANPYAYCGYVGSYVTNAQGTRVLKPMGYVGPTAQGTKYLPGIGTDNVTQAFGVNNNGVVVGRSGLMTTINGNITISWRGCIWFMYIDALGIIQFQPYDINTYLTPGSTARFDKLMAISDSGQIVGTTAQGAQYRAMILTPHLSPAALVLPGVIYGGENGAGTVYLDGRNTGAPLSVVMTSSNPAALQTPATVTIPTGGDRANFTVTTSIVNVSSTVTVTASLAGASKSRTVRVNPTVLGSITFAPSTITGGFQTVGTVRLFGKTGAAGATVALASSNPAVAPVPASVLVPAGGSTATFNVMTAVVTTDQTITVSGSYNGITRTGTLKVVVPFLQAFTLAPTTVAGGNAVTGTITLSGPAQGAGAVVQLLTTNGIVAPVPTTVTVPTGATTVNFTINTTVPATSPTNVQITARYRLLQIVRGLIVN